MYVSTLRMGGLILAPCLALLLAAPAQAHHLIDISGLAPTPLNGLLSGLAHPVIGPDHLLFLLALALTGLSQRRTWMLTLLAVGLLGNAAGLIGPGLPGAEALVSLSLLIEALVLLQRLPAGLLVPSMALHGYVLSASVLGWTTMPVASYLLGLMLCQGALLLLALWGLQPLASKLQRRGRAVVVALLLGFGMVSLVGQALG
ncbi:MAG: HupE/UreJ family protein [Cyanobacteriota bacterium]|nr:HupE/UreJ family protein [Cyanobacteriota bacterium]